MEFNEDEKAQRALRVYRDLVKATEDMMALQGRQLDSLGLTMSQYRLLEMLLRRGPMGQGTLGAEALASGSNTTIVIHNLERRGLVVRRPDRDDTRRKVVHLTPEGQKLVTKVFPMQARLVQAQMAALDGREQERLARLCRKLGRGNPERFVELTVVDE
jgi:MarR family transcriptional regulator, 2-MHQ and catechol-resistance regulon repressor